MALQNLVKKWPAWGLKGSKITTKNNFPTEPKLDLHKIHLCSGLSDMLWIICRPKTMRKFSTRWSSHRTNWNKPDCKFDNHQMALSRRCSVVNHGVVNKSALHETYTVIFVEQPDFYPLNTCKNKQYQNDAKINIQSMILSRVKLFLHKFFHVAAFAWPDIFHHTVN